MPPVNPYPYVRDYIKSASVANGAVEQVILDEYWTQLEGVIVGLGLEISDLSQWTTCSFRLYINGQRAGDYGAVADMITPPADITPTLQFVPSGGRIQVTFSNASGAVAAAKARVRVEERQKPAPQKEARR